MTGSGHDWRLRVSHGDIEQMTAAAAVIRECRQRLAARDTNILKEVAAEGSVVADWRHYPQGDVFDPGSHAQYFFHAHPANARPTQERGHFHTFLRAEGMPPGVVPLLLPELAIAGAPALPPQAAPIKRGLRDEVSHLVAIAVDHRGEPVRLFTTNRWVTGETWYRADDVIEMLDRFEIAESEPSEALNRWIGAMMRLFRPQIGALLRARDEAVMAWRRRRTEVFEDPRLEVTSSLEIALDTQLAFIDAAHGVPTGGVLQSRAVAPLIGDGWEQNQTG